MIYLQMGILILEIGLCYLINGLLKDTLNKKIRYAICIALLINCSNMHTYQAMWAVHKLFCLLVLLIAFKKRKSNFYLLGEDFVDESTSKEDMEILFKKLRRLTKVAPVYFVYGNHENKIKFTKNKLNQETTKNNITILNDQEVQLNDIILIGRKDYNLTSKTYNIVLDHQPQGTKENIKNNVDLQLSGHTHNGQMFPLSYSYHLQPDFAGNYGKETFKHHTKIISSELVGWGFPIRTEGICEYVVVNIKQDK